MLVFTIILCIIILNFLIRQQNIYVGSGSTGAIIRNNICYTGTAYQNNGVSTTQDHNLFGTNPLFVNAAANDFQLQSGSPAIDAGTSLGAPTTDMDGVSRPQGGAVISGLISTFLRQATPKKFQ